MSYTPQEGSVAYKAIEFLTTHPDEELTTEDVAAKFDKPVKQVHSLLGLAVEKGALERQENDGEIVYRLGTGVPAIKPNPGGAPSLRAGLQEAWSGVKRGEASSVKRKADHAPNSIAVIDLHAVQFETDVPIPDSAGRPKIDWNGFLDRMATGQSCLLPKGCRATLAKYLTDRKKAGQGEFALRLVSESQLRLWRVK